MGDEKRDARFWAAMRQGGQRASLHRGQVLHERKGGETVRVTYLDRTNDVRPLMSHRLAMDDGLRAVGNVYGDALLISRLGPGTTFAQEAVDGGKNGTTGGVSVRMVEAAEVARIAQTCLAKLPAVKFTCKTKASHGAHDPITVRFLVDAICAYGQDFNEIGLRCGWWIAQRDPKTGKTRPAVVHRKQKIRMRDGLIVGLEHIDKAFGAAGIDARKIGVLEIRR